MYPMELIKGVKLITGTCFNIRGGERVIIAGYTDEDIRLATLLAAEMGAANAEVCVVIVEPPKNIEPPLFLSDAMKKVDIMISLGDVDYGHTMARKEATSLKYAYMPSIMSKSMVELESTTPEDLLEIENRTEKLAEAVTYAKEAHVTSSDGTDIFFDIEGRKGIPIHPVLRRPGHLAIIPHYAEVASAPVEGKAKGTYVTNGSIWGHASMECIVGEKLYWTVEKGKVVDIRGGREAQLIEKALSGFDENAWRIAELGIGTHHKLPQRLTGTKRDDAILGHVHVALGRNVSLGGTQWSQIHVDFLSMNVRIALDGNVVIENGQLLL